MKLKRGQMAPLFQATDLYGRPFALDDYRGVRVLLSFYRAAVCPLCNLRLWHLIDRTAEYQRKGIAFVAVFESSPEYAHEYLDRMRPSFAVIPDLQGKLYDLYGLKTSLLGTAWARLARNRAYREAAAKGIGGRFVANLTRMDGRFSRMPGDFLLGPDLRVGVAYYGRDAGDFLLFSELDAYLASGEW